LYKLSDEEIQSLADRYGDGKLRTVKCVIREALRLQRERFIQAMDEELALRGVGGPSEELLLSLRERIR
jgi:hypothetical protein